MSEIAKTGVELNDIAGRFMSSQEFTNLYGNDLSDNDFIESLYENTLGRSSDVSGKAHWLDELGTGMARSEALVAFSESDEHVALTLTGATTPDVAALIEAIA